MVPGLNGSVCKYAFVMLVSRPRDFLVSMEGLARGLEVGMRVLWAGVSTGKKGGPSTKREVFSGYVHSWEDNDFVFLS